VRGGRRAAPAIAEVVPTMGEPTRPVWLLGRAAAKLGGPNLGGLG